MIIMTKSKPLKEPVMSPTISMFYGIIITMPWEQGEP